MDCFVVVACVGYACVGYACVCWCLCVGLCVCRVCRVGQSVSSQGVSSQVVSMCVRDGDGEQVDRELDHDDQVDRDHGVRELDALRLQDGYLLCVMDCFVVMSGMRVSGMRVSGMRVSGMRVLVSQ